MYEEEILYPPHHYSSFRINVSTAISIDPTNRLYSLSEWVRDAITMKLKNLNQTVEKER